jgi:hypothetical protein|tara:strand:- start:277 stop:519 length:243 start_codon:yes stop_codon:yes gene_type:complete
MREILFKQNGIKNSFQWIILAFVLGYRTFEFVPSLKLHPIEIFFYSFRLSFFRFPLGGKPDFSRIPNIIVAEGRKRPHCQ